MDNKLYAITDIVLKPENVKKYSEFESFDIDEEDLRKLDFYVGKIIYWRGRYYKVKLKEFTSSKPRVRRILLEKNRTSYETVFYFSKNTQWAKEDL